LPLKNRSKHAFLHQKVQNFLARSAREITHSMVDNTSQKMYFPLKNNHKNGFLHQKVEIFAPHHRTTASPHHRETDMCYAQK